MKLATLRQFPTASQHHVINLLLIFRKVEKLQKWRVKKRFLYNTTKMHKIYPALILQFITESNRRHSLRDWWDELDNKN